MDEIENKMSKIIRKLKKNSKPRNFRKKISYIYIFLKKLLEIFRICW